MLTPSPALAASPLVDTHLALLRATPLGAALERAAAPWRVDNIRPTVQAVHFLLSQGLSELHVAVAGTDVIEESWRVSNELPPTSAWEVSDELSSLGSAIESAVDDVGEVMIRLDKLHEESGPHARRRLDLLRWLDTFASEASDVARRLQALSLEAGDLGDRLEEEGSP